jgi:transposase
LSSNWNSSSWNWKSWERAGRSGGGRLKQFGEDVSEQLEYVPESFKVIRYVRPKFACNQCERVVEAPAPSRPIERGLAGPALLAHVLVSKFCDYVGFPVMWRSTPVWV